MLVHNTLSSFNELLTLLSIPGITFGFSEKFRFMMLDKINALLAEYVNIYDEKVRRYKFEQKNLQSSRNMVRPFFLSVLSFFDRITSYMINTIESASRDLNPENNGWLAKKVEQNTNHIINGSKTPILIGGIYALIILFLSGYSKLGTPVETAYIYQITLIFLIASFALSLASILTKLELSFTSTVYTVILLLSYSLLSHNFYFIEWALANSSYADDKSIMLTIFFTASIGWILLFIRFQITLFPIIIRLFLVYPTGLFFSDLSQFLLKISAKSAFPLEESKYMSRYLLVLAMIMAFIVI